MQQDSERVSVSGAGYVGLATAVFLIRVGHEVVVVDVDRDRISGLAGGESPLLEPGLGELIRYGVDQERLWFTTSEEEAMSTAGMHMVCVPTPDDGGGLLDLSMVESSVLAAVGHLPSGSVLVVRSTVPVGTCCRLAEAMDRDDLEVVFNPEFLQVGRVVEKMFEPNRVVVGARDAEAGLRVERLYESLDVPVFSTDLTTAELVKQASNAYLAVRLSFVNEVAAMAGATDADVDEVFRGMGADPRIGQDFLVPGPGWGGSCLPKDARVLAKSAEVASGMRVVEAALESNTLRIGRVVDVVAEALGGFVSGRRIAILGLSFKAGTDDVRESPALEVADQLLAAGAEVVAYDPMVAVVDCPEIELVTDVISAARGADALVVVTAWPEFRDLDYATLASVVSGRHVVDACRVVDPAAVVRAGLEFVLAD